MFSFGTLSGFPADPFFDVVMNAEALPIVTTTALVFLGCEFLLVPARIVSLHSGTPQEKTAIGRLFEQHHKVFFGRLATSFVGIALVIEMLVRSEHEGLGYGLVFLIILTSETLDRYLFYAAREASRL